MKIQLKRLSGGHAGGPRLIAHIPDIDPCLVEGANGIGKSLAIQLLQLVAGEQPVAKVAKDLWISESCLRRWMAVEEVDAGRREGLTSAERAELVALRRRTRVLEMENEILKRASAYFARENILPKP